MAAKVVENNDVAGRGRRSERLLDVGVNYFSVYRVVNNAGLCQLAHAQRRQKGQYAPASIGHMTTHALTAWTPASVGPHICLDPGFVDKDQARPIKAVLHALPACPASHHFGALLLLTPLLEQFVFCTVCAKQWGGENKINAAHIIRRVASEFDTEAITRDQKTGLVVRKVQVGNVINCRNICEI